MAVAQERQPQEEGPARRQPAGQPVVPAFLGVPLLDSGGQVLGGLLAGHHASDHVSQEDEALLVCLTAQGDLALEKVGCARLTQELQTVMDLLAEGVTLLDAHGRVVQENGAARRVREHLQTTPTGEQAFDALLQAPAQLALSGQVVEQLPVTLPSESNKTQGYAVTASPIHQVPMASSLLSQEPERTSTSNHVSGAVVIWQEVPELRMHEVALQAQERTRYLEAIFEAMVDGVSIYDQRGRIVQMNSAAHTLLARTQSPGTAALPLDERLGGAMVTDVAGQRLTPEQWHITRMLQGERFTSEHAVEVQMPTHDGGVLSASVTGGPICDARGQIIGAVGISRDVTERMHLEQHLRTSEREARERTAQLEAIFEAITDAVFVFDADGMIVQMNTAAHKLLGLDVRPDYTTYSWAERLAQLHLRDRQGQVLPREQWPLVRLLHGEELTGLHARDVLLQPLDGGEIRASIAGTPLRDQDGRVIGAVMTVRDLSERYRLQQRLEEAERQARERAKELEAIFEAVPDALFVYDHRGRIAQTNTAAHRLFGLESEPDTMTRPLEQVVRLAPRDWQGQVLPREQWPVVRLLNGEVLTM